MAKHLWDGKSDDEYTVGDIVVYEGGAMMVGRAQWETLLRVARAAKEHITYDPDRNLKDEIAVGQELNDALSALPEGFF